MQIHRLTAHPARPPARVTGVQVRWHYLPEGGLFLRWRNDGARDVVLPPFAGRGRADDLWKTTCFELFLDRGDGAYREFNFSPSGRWAAYDFSSRRVKFGNVPLRDEPEISFDRGSEISVGAIRVPAAALGGSARGNLCAVIEEQGSVVSFWAVTHYGEEPDFHDPACLTLDFTPPQVP